MKRFFPLFFFLLFAWPTSTRAVFVPQEVVSIPTSLGVLGLTGWLLIKAATEESFDDGPDYNISASSHEGILLRKLEDLRPTFHFPSGIKTISRRTAQRLLADPHETGPDGSSFGLEILSYLQTQTAQRKQSAFFPYFEGGTSSGYTHLRSPARDIPGVQGSVNPFLAMNEGRFIDEGNLGWLGFHSRGSLIRNLSYEFNPEWLLSDRATTVQPRDRFYLHRGYVKYTLGKLELEAGRDNVEWGYGRYSSMLMSSNSEPFYFFSMGNSQPVPAPGFLSFLGPTRSQFFITAMDQNQVHGHSILVGNRFSFLPLPTLEFGITYVTQFGGQGIGWNPLGYFGDSLAAPNGRANRGVVADVRARIPQLKVDPFLEIYWEDCCTNIPFSPRDSMMTVGLYFPSVAGDGKLDYTIEWTRTNDIAYRHGAFLSGYFHERHGFGHPLGPEGDGVYHTLRYFASPGVLLKLLLAQEGRGVIGHGDAGSEQRYRGLFNFYWEMSRVMSLSASVGYEHVQNLNFVTDKIDHNYLGSLVLKTNY